MENLSIDFYIREGMHESWACNGTGFVGSTKAFSKWWRDRFIGSNDECIAYSAFAVARYGNWIDFMGREIMARVKA